jgi:hypothetical protein
MGGGMKVGINIWRALNNNDSLHPAWLHLAHAPLTEADLPRSIEPTAAAASRTTAESPAGDATAASDDFSGVATAAAAAAGAAKLVGRKPTIEVTTFAENEESDEDLALRMH